MVGLKEKSNNFGWKSWERISPECRACQSELFGHSRGICVAFDGGSFEQEEEIDRVQQHNTSNTNVILRFRDLSRFV